MNNLPGFENAYGKKPEEQQTHGREQKPRLKLINRSQLLLLPVDVERLVPDDHEVRAIWEFTGYLDLTPYYQDIAAVEGRAGCTAFDPRLLISIWIYSYSKGISSAREISRLCEYTPAYQWLTGMEPINYHTLSDFRVANKEALDQMFVTVLGILSSEGLITLERVMHDGTKVKACAGHDSFRREERIVAHLEAAKEQVRLMEESPDEEANPRVQKARERAVREKKEKLELALLELEKIRETKSDDEKKNARVSMADPQSRIMKESDGGYNPAYNVQISTDSTAGIIVGVGITQHADDYRELVPAVERIEENIGEMPDQVVADGGYTSRENILAMHGKALDYFGSLDGHAQSAGQFKKRGVDAAFRPENFIYNPDSFTYTCPQGKLLRYMKKETRIGRTNYIYKANAFDCQSCPCRKNCCPGENVKQRSIVRGVDDPIVVSFIEKMKTKEAKEIYKKRGAVAEFPNAWIKEKIGLRQFGLRGLLKVGIEALWACLTYNIQQWIRLCWRPKLALSVV